MRSQLGIRLPQFSEKEFLDLQEAKRGLDFHGMNYYTAQFARHRDEPPSTTDFIGNVGEFQENSEGVSIGDESGVHWLRSSPNQFRKFLGWIYQRYGKPIYVTENGCPCPNEDKMTKNESIEDAFRIEYFATHLNAISQAISVDGVDVKGYFAWSLFDNLGECRTSSLEASLISLLEWSDGYGIRFGVTYTDYDTLERTPKKSASFLKETFRECVAAR
jgi:beta-glucosidase